MRRISSLILCGRESLRIGGNTRTYGFACRCSGRFPPAEKTGRKDAAATKKIGRRDAAATDDGEGGTKRWTGCYWRTRFGTFGPGR
jgi:hypothetical protein